MQHFTSYFGEDIAIKVYNLDIQYQIAVSKTEILAFSSVSHRI